MRTSRKTDFRFNIDFRSSKNNFRGHDISQGLDWEPPSLSPHFLLLVPIDHEMYLRKAFFIEFLCRKSVAIISFTGMSFATSLQTKPQVILACLCIGLHRS